MNELIKIDTRKIGEETINAVNARELHAFLEVGKDFSDWIKAQIERARLVEHRDFEIIEVLTSPKKGSTKARAQKAKEYALTLDAGKHIGMLSNTEKGYEVREYFITCERVAHQAVQGTLTLESVTEAITAAMGWNPEWEQSPAEKLEQGRRCSKGTYEILKTKILPALERIEAKPIANLEGMKPTQATALLNAICKATSNPRSLAVASRAFPGLFGPVQPDQPMLPGLEGVA